MHPPLFALVTPPWILPDSILQHAFAAFLYDYIQHALYTWDIYVNLCLIAYKLFSLRMAGILSIRRFDGLCVFLFK